VAPQAGSRVSEALCPSADILGGLHRGAPVRAVLLDFYGTLGESQWSSTWLADLLHELGYPVPAAASAPMSGEALDGEEHDEHSASAETYAAWMRSRWVALLDECDVPTGAHAAVLAAIADQRAAWRMQLYPEVVEVLTALRTDGVRLVVCSNWDWDLDRQIERSGLAGLLDGRVSSAWVGARKPHPRMFAAALDVAGVDARDALFVGDNWSADIEGARAAGLRAVHVCRDGGPDDRPPVPEGVIRVADLRSLPDLC
jgi:putative hydrolase of the HAD superfamily